MNTCDNTNTGALHKNDKQGNEKRPDYNGSIKVRVEAGKTLEAAGFELCCETCRHYLKIHPDGYPGGMCSVDRDRLSCWPTDSCLDWERAENSKSNYTKKP
jgi:hypothetical protein